MSHSIVDFAVCLIKNSEQSKRSLKESKKRLVERDDELDELPEEGEEEVEVVEEEVPEEIQELTPVDTENADEFTESLTDKVFYCASCSKHFLATEDTPEDSIVCPVCESDELIVSIGSAENALDEPENEDVALEIQDEEGEEEGEEELEDSPEEYSFDEENLEEGLNILVKKYIKESKNKVKIVGGKITNEGNILLRAKYGARPVSIVLEGFKAHCTESKFILPGKSNLFKGCKLNCGIIKEGKTYKVQKFGFGFLMESAKGTSKVKGIIG